MTSAADHQPMAYEFEQPGRLAFEIRRVAAERLDHALAELSGGLSADPAEAVHTARKDLKKTRSLLRLVRASLGEDRFRAENDRLRAAAHHLAGAREGDALSESLAGLVEAEAEELSAEARGAANFWLARMRVAQGTSADVALAAGRASALIASARDDARTWALGQGGFALIEPGIRRTYRQGRRNLARAATDPGDETLHEGRKRVKDMWYSLRLIGPAWRPAIRPLADQAHELSDLLGDHHDLGELRAEILSGAADLAPANREELLGAVAARQAELHSAAIALGRRLYAEKPRRYTERLGLLWAAWEEEAAQQAGQDGLPGS
ncbi:MAG: CHAD domain-containing protein [Actinomycetota bacterium]|nr:CHAD domain-containing protein [Actinomycetota bacterium]